MKSDRATIILAVVCSVYLLPQGIHAAPAVDVSPDATVPAARDIALSRPGTYRLHSVERAQLIYDAERRIGDGNSIGNVPGFFKNTVYDANPTVLKAGASTKEVQSALDSASTEETGGVVRLEAGTYSLGTIKLRSNTRLEIDSAATIKMKNRILFEAGRGLTARTAGRAQQVINFEVTSTNRGKKFTIDESSYTSKDQEVPFLIASAFNFSISNVRVIDNYTVLPQIFLIPDADPEVGAKTINGKTLRNISFARCPSYGAIENIDGINQHTGYGTAQVFCGSHLLFRNLVGHGGVTLRLEPGSGPDNLNMAGPSIGAMHDILIENMVNYDGFAALFLSPHSKDIYNVSANGIHGYDSGFALIVLHGDGPKNGPIFTRGHFENVRISGSISLFKTKKGQNSHVGRMAMYFLAPKSRDGHDNWNDFKPDPSGKRWKTMDVIAPVLMTSQISKGKVGGWRDGDYSVNMSSAKISSGGLLQSKPILYRIDAKNLDGSPNESMIKQ